MALEDANYAARTELEMDQAGVIIGSGIGSIEELTHNHQLLLENVCTHICTLLRINTPRT